MTKSGTKKIEKSSSLEELIASTSKLADLSRKTVSIVFYSSIFNYNKEQVRVVLCYIHIIVSVLLTVECTLLFYSSWPVLN